MEYYKKYKNFTLKNLPDLNDCVLAGLDFLSKIKKKKIPKFEEPILVIGCVNAYNIGKIIFEKNICFFSNENKFESDLKKYKNVKSVVIISASASKHSNKIIEVSSKKFNKKVFILTNNKNLKPINKNVKIISFDKMREPYTYNFTTYLSMLFSKTNENILKIINEIKQIDKQLKKWDFSKFKSFFVILEDKFELVVPMLKVKFEELFGQEVGGDAFTYSTSLHAKTVKEDKKQLFISLNKKNDFFGFKENRLNINFKNKIGNLGMIAIGYFVIGKIQKSKPDYFKKNIKKYCIKISKKFGKELLPIVE